MGHGEPDERAGPLEELTVLVPPGVRPTSLSSIAYYLIRDLLVTLELPPGSGVDEAELRERLQLGRTPVREAVRRLADEGLVTVYARRGTVVAPIDVRDLRQVSEVRVDLEGLGARLAAQRAGEQDRDRARELLAVIDERAVDGAGRRSPAAGEIEDAPRRDRGGPGELTRAARSLIRTDQRVHHCVYRATHNRYLQDTLGTYLTLSLRLWFLGLERVQRLDEAVDEHRDLLAAVIDGDADRAERVARCHVTGFWEEMRRVLTD